MKVRHTPQSFPPADSTATATPGLGLVPFRDAAVMLGVSVRTLENRVADRVLVPMRNGRKRFFSMAALRRYVDAGMPTAPSRTLGRGGKR